MAEFPDKVRLVFKDFPLSFHAGALPAAVAARCAGEHGRYWEYHDLLFVAQPAFSKTDLLGYAARLGLPAEPFAACLESARHRDAVLADFAEGRAGCSGHPDVLRQRPPARRGATAPGIPEGCAGCAGRRRGEAAVTSLRAAATGQAFNPALR